MKKSLWNLYVWQLKDVILASLIAVLFAVVCYATVHSVVFAVTPLVTPFGFGDIAIEFVFGIFFFSAIFSPYIMQKPGVATVVGTLTGLIQILMGSAFSSTVLVSALVQGLSAEAVFAMFRYRKFNWFTMLLAALACTVGSFVLAWYRGLWTDLDPGFVATRFIIRAVSALLISGIAAKFLADRLAKAGVLKSYPLGAKYKGEPDES
ncbi:MAG: ECF transporter S component [Defluviitaleaceae bacterium]|nr:ECF transporter S component [Defluviitaleaceae bacterium]MCL2604012.1 ECF transporter S component [Defluviitaleaceae bacterium]